jgi:hypothetical protein
VFTATHRYEELCSAVLVNMSSKPVRADIRLPQLGGRLVDLLEADGKTFELAAGGTVPFAPYQARMLVGEGA